MPDLKDTTAQPANEGPARPSPPDEQARESPRRADPAERLRLRWSSLRSRVQARRLLTLLVPESAPLDMRILGRTLLHAAVVGVAAGLLGAAFFAGLEWMQHVLLERAAGYISLRAHGEQLLEPPGHSTFRAWLLVLLPAAGALVSGLLVRLAPETGGGGGDAMIHAFHRHRGVVRVRVIWVKALASLFTLGSGGAGGREGPTMQIGAALGSLAGRLLRATERERRVLFVAGVAAGMSAVFRTPLGAALLAIEVLYRDDFEAEALVPAILASVTAYAIVISIFGESTLFARAPRYPFVPAHLPLFVLLAIAVALLAAAFVSTLRAVQRLSERLPGPVWARPALGGLGLGLMVVPAVIFVDQHLGSPGQGLGLLGGGYGAAQMAITGSQWLTGGWRDVELLLLLCVVKLLAASLTIGSGGSAGDFAPSLVLGGLLGGAFGRAAALLLHDPRIDPGAFALVGMGAFYGGIAHVPISSLIIVSELAGSYDLLVPLMLAEGVALVLLRRRSLYEAQPQSRAGAVAPSVATARMAVGELSIERDLVSFDVGTRADQVLARSIGATHEVFPVVDPGNRLRGVITAAALKTLSAEHDLAGWTVAADLMEPHRAVRTDTDVREAAEVMMHNDQRAVVVVDEAGNVVGLLDGAVIWKQLLSATRERREEQSEGRGEHDPSIGRS